MKSVWIHTALLVCALFVAYRAWTKEETGETHEAAAAQQEEEASVVLFDIQPDAVQEISFQSEKRQVKVAVTGRGAKRGFDVSTYRKDERRRPRPRPDAGPADAGARDAGPGVRDAGPHDAGPAPRTDAAPAAAADAGPEIEIVETRKRFSGNTDLAEYLGKVAPLKAKRSFGVVKPWLLREFELTEPRATITIRAGGHAHTLKVGGSTFGSSDAYVMDARTSKVYLVASDIVRDLEFAETRFMQRDLVAAEKKDIVKATVSLGERRRTLVQKNREQANDATWRDEAHADTANELYDNWMGRLLRLRALEYLEPGEEPHAEGISTPPETVFEIEYFGEHGSLGKVTVVKVDSDPAEYFARSDATRGWVKLAASLAEQVERDVDTVLGGG
jgi:hypothetical protein